MKWSELLRPHVRPGDVRVVGFWRGTPPGAVWTVGAWTALAPRRRAWPGRPRRLGPRPMPGSIAPARQTADGRWPERCPTAGRIAHGPIRLELKRTDFGHLGVFPEQAVHWDWIVERVQRASPPPVVLNLFAYTGGSTLAAAAAGAEVVHVELGEERSGLGPAQRGTLQRDRLPIRPSHPLDRRRRRQVRPPRDQTRQPLRCRDPRPAELWAWRSRRGVATRQALAAALDAVRRVDGRALPVHAADLPYAGVRCPAAGAARAGVVVRNARAAFARSHSAWHRRGPPASERCRVYWECSAAQVPPLNRLIP